MRCVDVGPVRKTNYRAEKEAASPCLALPGPPWKSNVICAAAQRERADGGAAGGLLWGA